jgi:predicted transcriptional regulator
MTITIDLEPASEQRLREIADAEGKDVSEVIRESVTERLRKSRSAENQRTWREMPKDEWLAEFDAWIKSHPQVDCPVDDSRESIYSDLRQ